MLSENALTIQKRYQLLGGPVVVIRHEGEGHFLPKKWDTDAVVDLILKSCSR